MALERARLGAKASEAELVPLALRLVTELTLPPTTRSLLAAAHAGFERASIFGRLPFDHGSLHSTMNMLKKIYNLMLRIAWGFGAAIVTRMARAINHFHVTCGKKARPGKGSSLAIEELMRVRGNQIIKLGKVFVHLARLLPVSPERAAFEHILELAHELSALLHMGTVRAQEHYYGEASAANLQRLTTMAQGMYIEVERALRQMFPCSRRYKSKVSGQVGACKNGFLTRSISNVYEIVTYSLPKGMPAMDEEPMEQLNGLLRELYLNVRNLLDDPAEALLNTAHLIHAVELEAKPVPKLQEEAARRRKKQDVAGPQRAQRAICLTAMLREARLTPKASTHMHIYRAASSGEWRCDERVDGAPPIGPLHVIGYKSHAELRIEDGEVGGDDPEDAEPEDADQGVEGAGADAEARRGAGGETQAREEDEEVEAEAEAEEEERQQQQQEQQQEGIQEETARAAEEEEAELDANERAAIQAVDRYLGGKGPDAEAEPEA